MIFFSLFFFFLFSGYRGSWPKALGKYELKMFNWRLSCLAGNKNWNKAMVLTIGHGGQWCFTTSYHNCSYEKGGEEHLKGGEMYTEKNIFNDGQTEHVDLQITPF